MPKSTPASIFGGVAFCLVAILGITRRDLGHQPEETSHRPGRAGGSQQHARTHHRRSHRLADGHGLARRRLQQHVII